jgi:uncharacterized protein YggE
MWLPCKYLCRGRPPLNKLLLLFVPVLLFSQEPLSRPPLRIVQAVGEATVKAAPDQAKISVGINTRASTAEKAVVQSASKTTPVVSVLKSIVGSSGDIRTANYSVEPEYKYEQGQSPTITAYMATQTIQVTLNDVALVGKVIDACARAGANNFNQIEFGLKDDGSPRREAITKATAKARANAEAIAKALGVAVTGIAWAETTGAGVAPPRPMPMMKMQSMAATAPTPIEAGTLEIQASVTVALEVR